MTVAALDVQRFRIGLQATAFLGAGLLLLVISAVAAWSFITPEVSEEYRLGPASAFAPGTVTSFVRTGDDLDPFLRSPPSADWGWPAGFPLPAGEFVHVVRLPDGQFRVFAGVSPHRNQTVLWFPDGIAEVGEYGGLFGDDFSFWLVDGTLILGPSPRDLPTYRYRVGDDGALVIDLSQSIDGPRLPDERGRLISRSIPPPYDVLDPAWPTSGWPTATN